MKHFLWQSLAGHVAAASNLVDRHCGHDRMCQRCGAAAETINYILFECPPAIQCWALSTVPSNPGIFPSCSLFNNMDYLMWRAKEQGVQPKHLEIFPWLTWYIWKARNAKVFQGKHTSPKDTVDLAMAEAHSWQAAQLVGEAIDEASKLRAAEPPPTPKKQWCCHIDASWIAKNSTTGLGFSLSKDNDIMLQGIKGCLAIKSTLHAELTGLIWAMATLVERRHTEVHFYTDCQQMVHMLEKKEEWPAFASELDEFEFYRILYKDFSISFISRSQNIRADGLSKGARARENPFTFVTTETEALLALEANSSAFTD